ncbi:hypothetical protein BJX63DRAFT_437240 [Aspergillus granulosus]|uniref:Uncharacterized protein n=1 Tax=Aspergillus granulosus TaxID=176169 RepID=A0ABR4GVN4_9EURO
MVLNLKRIVGQTDQLVDSTCRGMRARKQAGQIPEGLNDGEDILTYNGGGRMNRYSSVKCDGSVKRQMMNLVQIHTSAMNTHQVVSSHHIARKALTNRRAAQYNQEGNAQTALCIERYQNSGTQGPILGAITRNCKPNKGDKLLIRVEGGCPDYFIKRDDEAADILHTNATLRDPMGDGLLTYVAVDLGELQDGHYNLDVALDGRVTNLTVLEGDGETYVRVDSPPEGPVRLTWDVVTDGAYLTFAVIAYTEEAVNVSYTGNFTPSSTSITPSRTETSNATSSVHNWSPAAILVSFLTAWLV